MWGEVLGLALVVSLNPLLLAFILLVISRPRPVPNLLAFWVGCLIVNLPGLLVPLMAMHMVPTFASFARDVTTADEGSTVQPLQTAAGVISIVIAIVMAVRLWVRRRAKQPAAVGADGGGASVMVQDFNTPTDGSRPMGRIKGALAHIRSAISRLLRKGQDAWDSGSLWISIIFGLGYIAPPPLVLLVDTIIVGSGAAIGTQAIAAILFVFAMLAVFEIALLSYVVAPVRTQALLEPLHNWARTHRQQVLLGLFAVVGFWQVVTGTGTV